MPAPRRGVRVMHRTHWEVPIRSTMLSRIKFAASIRVPAQLDFRHYELSASRTAGMHPLPAASRGGTMPLPAALQELRRLPAAILPPSPRHSRPRPE